MNAQTNAAFRNSSAHPIRYDKLHPGSYFRVEKETSRTTRKSRDQRVYRKARDGFYAVVWETKQGAVFYPEDLVMPLVPADRPPSKHKHAKWQAPAVANPNPDKPAAPKEA